MAEVRRDADDTTPAKVDQVSHRQRLEAMKERLAGMKIVLRPDDLERYLDELEKAPDLGTRARRIVGRCYK